MEKFIHQQNLNLLRKCLTEVQGEATRKLILQLLAEEEAKLRASEGAQKERK
jgi:hypothetical protein